MSVAERSEFSPPLGRDMPCPNCGHASHSPFICEIPLLPERAKPRCPCRFVPIPGAQP